VFIAMPSRRTKTGEYKDVAHPINSEFRSELQEKILKAYHEDAAAPGGPTDADDAGDEEESNEPAE